MIREVLTYSFGNSQTINGHSSYYLRAINNIYTVGQTVPNEFEVPGPHARKNTNTAKLRLMVVAWLLINKSKQKRIKMSKVMKYFPDQSELQMRQRLKVKGNVGQADVTWVELMTNEGISDLCATSRPESGLLDA